MSHEFPRDPSREKTVSSQEKLLTTEQKERFEKLIFEFEKKLRYNLAAAEGGQNGREVSKKNEVPNQRFEWGMYVTYVTDILQEATKTDKQLPLDIEPKMLTIALAAYEALPKEPADRSLILKNYTSYTRSFADRSLIALSSLSTWEKIIYEKNPQITAAKSAAFHDWHDSVNFDNPKLPQPDGLFKYTALVQRIVREFIKRGFEMPISDSDTLDLEEMMHQAYQKEILPEANYDSFQRIMTPYFEDERSKQKNQK